MTPTAPWRQTAEQLVSCDAQACYLSAQMVP